MFYKDANAVVIVYDVTKAKSFEEIKNYWINQIKENSPENIILVIVANKSDLIEQKQVDEGEARNFANDLMLFLYQRVLKTMKVFLTYLKNWQRNTLELLI